MVDRSATLGVIEARKGVIQTKSEPVSGDSS